MTTNGQAHVKKLAANLELVVRWSVIFFFFASDSPIFRKSCGEEKEGEQPRELGKKYDGNFIFTFAVLKVRYGGITTAKIFKLSEVVIIILFSTIRLFLYMFICFLRVF